MHVNPKSGGLSIKNKIMASSDEGQVGIRLVAVDQQYAVPDAPLAVPASLNRFGLSEVVNQMLELENRVPFDFSINGQLVRSSLSKHLAEKGVSKVGNICGKCLWIFLLFLLHRKVLLRYNISPPYKHHNWKVSSHFQIGCRQFPCSAGEACGCFASHFIFRKTSSTALPCPLATMATCDFIMRIMERSFMKSLSVVRA